MYKKLFTCITVFGLFLQGCMVSNKEIKAQDKPTVWNLKKLENRPLHVKTTHPISLELDRREYKFYGNDGCNSIFGTLKSFDDEKIQFGMLGGTRMACEHMEVSSKYISLLQKAYFYEKRGSTLLLLDKTKNSILEFSSEPKK